MTAPALELKQLTKRFGDKLVVDRVDLTVPRNSVVALVGESGSGKTTTGLVALRLIGGDLGPDPARRRGHHASQPERR